jgi:hypothetical protein
VKLIEDPLSDLLMAATALTVIIVIAVLVLQ